MEANNGTDGVEPRQLKRRKVRKGTQSCWECKRRKIRCTFVRPTESVCDGCRSRRVKCISQEYDIDDTPQPEHLQENGYGRYDGICRSLVAVWPQQTDLEVILSVPVSIPVLFHGLICRPFASLLDKETTPLRDILQLPRAGSHPVLVARKLLLLAIFLQGVPRGSVKDLGHLSTTYTATMSRLVETASKLVTCDDDLVSSLEGIECIMIESMYHNDAGNLRRAWITHRRAVVTAQMMGLHRGLSPSTTAKLMLDGDTQDRIDPEHMWYRLIITDRYLSLMLGLPQASLKSPFASPDALEACSPMERMERMESVAGGLILERNKVDIHDLARTREIDKVFQEAAALMPPQWWLAPDVATIIGDDREALGETLRLMIHFTHYHLLAQLHLPYLLLPSNDRKYDYSKLTAVMASREILARFVSFRSSDAVTAYCRGIDLLAFIASAVLSIAHMDARRQQQQQQRMMDSGEGVGTVLDSLTHQRLSDRGLLERTLSCMRHMAESDNDAMASKISEILQHLLAIEAAAADGVVYRTSISSEPDEHESQYGIKTTDGVGDALRIHIPYFGTVVIEHGDDSRSVSEHLRGISPSTEPVAYQIGGEPVNPDWQSVPSHIDPIPASEQDLRANLDENYSLFQLDHAGTETASLLVPGLTADVDDWALQGVDMVLFDNLFRPGAADGWSEQ